MTTRRKQVGCHPDSPLAILGKCLTPGPLRHSLRDGRAGPRFISPGAEQMIEFLPCLA